MDDDREYEPVKKSRGWYFVEYHPPMKGFKFGNLQLTIMENRKVKDIIDVMEKELSYWLMQYPVPLFVTSFDTKEDVYDLSGLKSCNYLIGYIDDKGNVQKFWELIKDEDIPDIALNKEFVDKLFSNIKYRTHKEMDLERTKWRKQLKRGWFVFFIWISVIPAIWALAEYFSNLLSIIVLIYSLYKAIRAGLELMGKWPKSKKTKEKEKEETLKQHYYYHCQMNPKAFTRLKIENMEQIIRKQTEEEFINLRSN